MAPPRRILLDIVKRGAFQWVTSFLRSDFLDGRDSYPGQDYEHRCDWIRDRLWEAVGDIPRGEFKTPTFC